MDRTSNYDGFVLNREVSPKLVVEDGDWRLYELRYLGHSSIYRAYHRHDENWVSQLTLFRVCAWCRDKAPAAMEGFEKLIRWKG